MSQFLVTGQPFENLRLLSEGQYRTEAQSRYEVLSAKSNSFKTRFLNAAVISAFFVIIIANMFRLAPKTVIASILILATIWTVISPAPAKFPNSDERIAIQDIFAGVTELVDFYAKAKIEAIQVLLVNAKLNSPKNLALVLNETSQLYDNPEKKFQLPPDHNLIKYVTSQNRNLSEAQEQLRETSVQVREYAQKLLNNLFQIPPQLQGELRTLKTACGRLLKIHDFGLKPNAPVFSIGVTNYTITLK